MQTASDGDLRPLRILSALASREDASAGELASATDMSRPTTYRLLNDLEEQGWVIAGGSPKRYTLSARLVELGIAAMRRFSWRPAVFSAAMELSAEIGLPSSTSIYDRGDVIILDGVRRSGGRTTSMLHGSRTPALVTAAGKILLAYQDAVEIERAVTRDVPAYTAYTTHDPDRFREELRESRERGFAVADREFNLRTAGVAMAVRDAQGCAVAAIGVTVFPLDQEVISRIVPAMHGYVERASFELGFREPVEVSLHGLEELGARG